MDKITRAMLGDREAQEELTEKGVLLPCPFCGKDAIIHTVDSQSQYVENKKEIPKGAKFIRCVCYPSGKRYFEYRMKEYIPWCVDTSCLGRISKRHKTMKEAIGRWNTRAPILTPEQIERLEALYET